MTSSQTARRRIAILVVLICSLSPSNVQLNPICHLLALLGAHYILHVSRIRVKGHFNPLNGELNLICHLLALLGAHHILHVSRIRVKGHFNPVNTELNPICQLLALLGAHHILHISRIRVKWHFNPSNTKLNPICHLLALLGAHHILHISRIRVKFWVVLSIVSYHLTSRFSSPVCRATLGKRISAHFKGKPTQNIPIMLGQAHLWGLREIWTI